MTTTSSLKTKDDLKTAEQVMISKRSDFANYLAIETVGGGWFHPKCNDIVFVYNAAGLYQIYRTSVQPQQPPSWPQRLTHSPDRCTNPRYLSDQTVVYVSDHGGDEHFQLYLIDTEYKTHKLSVDDAAKHCGLFSCRNYLYFSANSQDKAMFDVYRQRIPVLQNKPEVIYAKATGIIDVSVVSPKDENKVIIHHYHNNSHSDLVLVDLDNDGQRRCLTEQYNKEQKALWSSIRFLDDVHVLCTTNYRCDFERPVILNMETLLILYFEELEKSVQFEFGDSTYNEGDPFTYFAQNEHGYSKLYRAVFGLDDDCKSGVISELTSIELPFQGVLQSGDQRTWTKAMHLNASNDLLLITMSNSHTPTNMFAIDIQNECICSKVSNGSTPGVDVRQFVDSSLHSFASFDELQISYFRYLPLNDALCQNGKFPTMMVIHGGPESQFRPSFKSAIQFFIASGFMVVAPNVRGSRGYGLSFMSADNVRKRMDSVRDVHELAMHLKSNDDKVDGDRLIIYGASYGGFKVLSGISEYPELFVAGVDIVGICNFVSFLENTAKWRRPLREAEYGSLEHDRDFLIKISPITKMDRIKCPLFIIQGDNDERVPLEEAIQIYDALKDKNLNTVLLRFDDEGHGVTKLKNKLIAYRQVLTWLIEIVK